ncbi:hypothetical protein B10190_09810 [Campylobacter jejuni]|nr:hypothetical protein B10190_09810 [Campylobacter jejuni]
MFVAPNKNEGAKNKVLKNNKQNLFMDYIKEVKEFVWCNYKRVQRQRAATL